MRTHASHTDFHSFQRGTSSRNSFCAFSCLFVAITTLTAGAQSNLPPAITVDVNQRGARVSPVLYGIFFEPEIAAAAQGRDEIVARFTEGFEVKAKVLKTTDGNCVGRRGIWAGRALELGPTCALKIGGITVVCVSRRKQCADPVFFEMHGLDIGAARTVVVKSRGHFRGGFDEFFPPERVIEVDTPGLTSPVLERLAFKGLPRPVFPLDADAQWTWGAAVYV